MGILSIGGKNWLEVGAVQVMDIEKEGILYKCKRAFLVENNDIVDGGAPYNEYEKYYS